MAQIRIDFSKPIGKMKPMHGVNSGPRTKVFTYNATHLFREAGIPFCRTHDVEYPYGSGEFVDMHCIFPNFDADENDPASYNFGYTDCYLEACRQAGSDILFRLGESIENGPVKRHIFPPKDFSKWARISEHIIRHYNEGWANGYEWNITHWEIWNEPDLDRLRTWGGTYEQFCDFYETAVRHLKSCFPNLKIGGPAITGNTEWGARFIRDMAGRKVPMDFFSWHKYFYQVETLREKALFFRQAMDENGYTDAEIYMDEWNYMEDWANQAPSFRKLVGVRGAAFCGATLIEFQHLPVDIATYFEADVVKEWCGIFEVRNMSIASLSTDAKVGSISGMSAGCILHPRKPFYAFRSFGKLYALGQEAESASSHDHLHVCAAANGESAAAMVVSYRSEFVSDPTDVQLTGLPAGGCKIRVYLTDEGHENELEAEYAVEGETAQIRLRMDDEQVRLIEIEKA